jgi:phosphoribosylglycinamide formyltransferase 1
MLPGCEIAVVISNVPGAPGIDTARGLGLPVVAIEGRGREQREHEHTIGALLRKFRVDLVCLTGYRRVLSASFVREWPGRILQSHPSLLPAFPGRHAESQALDYGVQVAGCTVQLVDESVDGGVIVVQRAVPVRDEDDEHSLAERILAQEQVAYPDAIRRVLSGNYEIRRRRYVARDTPHRETELPAELPPLPDLLPPLDLGADERV